MDYTDQNKYIILVEDASLLTNRIRKQAATIHQYLHYCIHRCPSPTQAKCEKCPIGRKRDNLQVAINKLEVELADSKQADEIF